jgi:hypothetical protein
VVGGSGVFKPMYNELPVGRGVVFGRFVAVFEVVLVVVVSVVGLRLFANGFFFGTEVLITLSEPL